LSSLLGEDALAGLLEKLGRILARLLANRREPPRVDPPDGASRALHRLKRGELSLGEYLDTRVAAAVAPLEGVLHADDLRYVRAVLRDKLDLDPRLRRLVERLTRDLEVHAQDR
jgi:hypothetical protein